MAMTTKIARTIKKMKRVVGETVIENGFFLDSSIRYAPLCKKINEFLLDYLAIFMPFFIKISFVVGRFLLSQVHLLITSPASSMTSLDSYNI